MTQQSKPISHDQLIEDNVFGNVKKSAEEADVAVKSLLSGFKQMATMSGKKLMSFADPKTLQDVKNQRVEIEKITLLTKGYTEAQKQEIYVRERNKLILKQESDLIKANAAVQGAAKGSVQELRAELKMVSLQWAALSEIEKGNIAVTGPLSKQKLELTNKLKNLEAATGDHRREVGNYAVALKGLTGIATVLGEVFGIDVEKIKQLKEAHAILKHSIHGTHEVMHNLAGEHKAEAHAAKEGAEQAVKSAAARSTTIPVIGLVIAALAALAAAIYLVNERSKEEELNEMARSRAMDGTIIKSKELREAYNEHLIAVNELANGYKVLHGEMTQFEADIDNITHKTIKKASEAANEGLKKIQEAGKSEFLDFFKEAANSMTGQATNFETKSRRVHDAKEEMNKTLASITKEGEDEAKKRALEKDIEDDKEEKNKSKERARKSKEENDKYLAELRKRLEEMKRIQAEGVLEEQKLRDEQEVDKEAKIKLDMERWLAAKNAENEEVLRLLKYRQDQEKAAREQRINDAIQEQEQIINAIKQGLDNQNAIKEKYYQNQQSIAESNIHVQSDLAARGQKNMLDFELKEKAKALDNELQLKKKAQRQAEALQLANLFLEFEKVYAKDGSGAAGKALAQTLLAKGIATGLGAAFAEDGGVIGGDVKKYTGQKHKSGKDVWVLAEEKERILSVSDNKLFEAIGGMNLLKNPQRFMSSTHVVNDFSALKSELQDLKETIKNKKEVVFHKSIEGYLVISTTENGTTQHRNLINSQIVQRKPNGAA